LEEPVEDRVVSPESIREEEPRTQEHQDEPESEEEQRSLVIFTPEQLEILLNMNRPDFGELVVALKMGTCKGERFEPAKPRNPILGLSVMQLTLPKVGDLESSGTPKNSEDNLRGQISLHWCFFYINGKVLKYRSPKWPRMGHLDICSPS